MKKSFTLLFAFCLTISIHAQQIIKNPEKPLRKNAGRVVKLKKEMRITDAQGGFYFKNPYNIKVSPEGNIFVLDDEQLLRFDAQGKFLKNLFRKGQGPGEFMRIGNYLFRNNEIIINQSRPNKIVKMDMEGNMIKDFRPEKAVSKLIAYFNDKYVMARSSFPVLKKGGEEPEIIDIDWNILLVSEDGKIEETNHFFPAKWFAKRLPTAIIANFIVDFSVVPFRKKYLIISHTQDYLLKLLDLEKNQIIRTFNRKYKSVKYKPEKATKEEQKSQMRTLEVPRDYYNDIQKLLITKENIWVLTSTLDREKGILVDVFNIKGQYIDNFYLSIPKKIKLKDLSRHPITISEDFLFIVETDENDIPAIVKYEIIN